MCCEAQSLPSPAGGATTVKHLKLLDSHEKAPVTCAPEDCCTIATPDGTKQRSDPGSTRGIRAAVERGSSRCTFPAVPTIVLNGEPHPVGEDTTVAALVTALGLAPQQVAVEKNREIVPRSAYAQTPVRDGDRLEIVTFVGGG